MMNHDIQLRDVHPDDLPIFFEQQLDDAATQMAGFPSRDRAAFDRHWAQNVLGNPTTVTRTVLVEGDVAGYIGSWPQDGVRLVGYWIGKEYWGRGIATEGLRQFLDVVAARPLHAHVVEHNRASIRVLEKCGFRRQEKAIESGGNGMAEVVLTLS
jgi:RimJ/RimL family protein N-acetyltransferase